MILGHYDYVVKSFNGSRSPLSNKRKLSTELDGIHVVDDEETLSDSTKNRVMDQEPQDNPERGA